jgi:hypothetical protein
MGKDKLRKFAEVATFENVIQLDAGKEYKGKWAEKQFGNNNPVVLELACGKGEYTVNLARLFPEKISSVSILKVIVFGVEPRQLWKMEFGMLLFFGYKLRLSLNIC